MPQIIPIKDLKDTANVSELCHTLNEPIYITKDGYGDMVLMSMDYYENTRKKWEMYAVWKYRKSKRKVHSKICYKNVSAHLTMC